MDKRKIWRSTSQELAPIHQPPTSPGQYDLYPGFPLGAGKIKSGFAALAGQLVGQKRAIIDGYGGVFWEHFRDRLDTALVDSGLQATWISVDRALLDPEEVDTLVAPFLGGDDPLFGSRFTGTLASFFDRGKLDALQPDSEAELTILYGCGAALASWQGLMVYVDVPKNEIQFRSRAGAICNLGARQPEPAKTMYKRFYFVDWVALNRHKADLLSQIDLVVDEQRPDEPVLMTGDDLRAGLARMSRNYFRVRPWFEPGAWGGQWIKEKIPQLPQDIPNYAWSFELIVPENGLAFVSDGNLLEISFDFLMYYDHHSILGHSADRFGFEFPIRFDLLDTFDGGNLSLQCHPRPEFIRRHFGETFTQDETYYILDCKPGAEVYLGFRDGFEPELFRAELERSVAEGVAVDVARHVHIEPARKHDLFLIPNGTVHCSGKDCLVLEISATPYIFTFKMYDWMRLDLDGSPRPLNIDRAFQNLYFERSGQNAANELVSKPTVLQEGAGWRLIHMPTHSEHFYDVHRLEFAGSVEVSTDGSCHVLNLVEGESLILETGGGMRQRFNYAETFVVPAAANRYRLINEGDKPIKVVKAFMKSQ